MRFLALSFAVTKRMLRDPFTLFFAIIFPAFFVLIFSLAFGKSGPLKNQRIDLAVINRDEGLAVNLGEGPDTLRLGRVLVDVLRSASYSEATGGQGVESDSVTLSAASGALAGADSLAPTRAMPKDPIFGIADTVDEKRAVERVVSGDLDAVLIIPAGFTRAAMAEAMGDAMGKIFVGAMDSFSGRAGGVFPRKPTTADIQRMIDDISERMEGSAKRSEVSLDSFSMPSGRAEPVTLSLAGDPSRLGFSLASGILRNVLDEFLKKVAERTLEEAREFVPFDVGPRYKDLVSFESSSVEVEKRTVFDHQVPGIIVFALLMLVTLVAVTLALDVTQGHMDRLKLTRMTALDYFTGNMLPWLLLSIVQLALLFGVAKVLGFHNRGSVVSGTGIVLLGSLSSIALAFIIAGLAKNERQASAAGTLIAVPVSFLSGAFFPVGDIVIIQDFFGKPLGLAGLSPWTHCAKALAGVLTYGKDVSEVFWYIVMQVVLTVLLLLIGTYLFSRRRLSAQN